MLFPPFLTTRLGLFPRSASRNKTPVAGRRLRPMLEALEDRWVPSTLTVTSAADSGAGSLRAEIKAAHNGDTIVFAPKLDGQTITLTSGELLLSKNITINGPGAGLLTVSGDNLSRVFELSSTTNPTVTIEGLTIGNGDGVFAAGSSHTNDGHGGAILNEGNLSVSNCILSGSSAAGFGGGIYNDGTLTVNGSTLSGNSAAQWGGGILNRGSLTVNNSTLSGNSARAGGGIYDSGSTGGTATVSNSTLSGNFGGWGGAVNVDQGGTAHIDNCTLDSNSAAAGIEGGSTGIGGAIYCGGTVTLSGSTLSDNSATQGGGGIWIGSSGTVTAENSSSITGNTAPAGSGPDVNNLGTLDADSTSINNLGNDNGNQPILI